jgi:SsrA-binding protein
MSSASEIVTNRKALRDYHILERLEAGVELRGTEVKSIRAGHVQLQGSFAKIEGKQVFLIDSDILPYERASHEQHEPKRKRRLLLHRSEIIHLTEKTEKAGCTLVALRMYWKKGNVKVELGLGKGKAATDKRADLKKRVQQRETDRELANLQRKR